MQAHASLRRIGQQREQRQHPERPRAQCLGPRVFRFPGRDLHDTWCRAVQPQTEILGLAYHEQPVRQQPDQQYGDAHRQPARAPAAVQDRRLGEQRQTHQARHLRQRGNRGRESSARDEPVVDGAVDSEIERVGDIGAGDAEQRIEHRQRPR